jgi:predicted transcriptional regulator
MFCKTNVKRAKCDYQKNCTEISHLESAYAKLDVIKRILESTQNTGVQEHGLMYASYLSYMQIDEYLSVMAATGLVRYERESRTYRITAKGMDFLTSLRQMDHLMKVIDR